MLLRFVGAEAEPMRSLPIVGVLGIACPLSGRRRRRDYEHRCTGIRLEDKGLGTSLLVARQERG